jgi:uncharacterized protein (DUF1778 family)
MSKPVIFARMSAEDVQLIKKICEARGEQLSDFVRRSVRKELARLNYLSSAEKKALEVEA